MIEIEEASSDQLFTLGFLKKNFLHSNSLFLVFDFLFHLPLLFETFDPLATPDAADSLDAAAEEASPSTSSAAAAAAEAAVGSAAVAATPQTWGSRFSMLNESQLSIDNSPRLREKFIFRPNLLPCLFISLLGFGRISLKIVITAYIGF